MMNEAAIYKALGDPVRLEIVARLARQSPRTLGELSEDLGISRQGARKQIEVLASARVVQLVPSGRVTEVSLDTRTLETARQFIAMLEQQWDQRLAALQQFVESND